MICPGCNSNIPDDSKICKDCNYCFSESSEVSEHKDSKKNIDPQKNKLRVLIVDDVAFMRIMLKKLLLKNGFNVIGEADNGVVAIMCYKIYKPDIVIMDISMPGTKKYHYGGLDAIKDIITFDPSAKIMVCSALSDKSTVMEAIERGAKAYLIKPFDTKNLVNTINRLFE